MRKNTDGSASVNWEPLLRDGILEKNKAAEGVELTAAAT